MFKRILFFAYGSLSYLIFFGHIPLRDLFHRQLWCPQNAGRRRQRFCGSRPGDRRGPADALRCAAQRHGPQMVQGLVDAHCAEAARTVHLRPLLEPRAHPSVLAVAAIRAGWCGPSKIGWAGCIPARVIRVRLGAGARLHLPDQSLRSLWSDARCGYTCGAGPTRR